MKHYRRILPNHQEYAAITGAVNGNELLPTGFSGVAEFHPAFSPVRCANSIPPFQIPRGHHHIPSMFGEKSMKYEKEKSILYSKVKLTISTILCFSIAGVMVFMLISDIYGIGNSNIFYGKIDFSIGILSTIFFAACGIFSLRQLFDNSPGLKLSYDGFTDNSTFVSVGFVPWSEVVEIRKLRVQMAKFVSVQTKDPDRYINRGNFLQRMTNRVNLMIYKSPINVSSVFLRIKHDDLLELMEQYLANSRRNA